MATISRVGTAITAVTTGIDGATIDGTTPVTSNALNVAAYDHILLNVQVTSAGNNDNLKLEVLGSDGSNYGVFVSAVIIEVTASGTYFPFMIDKPPSNIKIRLVKDVDSGAAHVVSVSGVGYKYQTA